MGKRIPTIERYWAKVDTSAGPEACWPWTGSTSRRGYGCFADENHRTVIATRWGYRALVGPLSGASLFVCHRCDNPSCMNPAHWFLGTAGDNASDMVRKGRAAVGNRHGLVGTGAAATGERHGSSVHPESIIRGDAHYSRLTPERLARGETAGGAKLIEEQVQWVRAESARGVSNAQLARSLGVAPSTVRRIVIRRTWAHI